MKKLVALILVLVCLCSSMALADNNLTYLTYAVSSQEYMKKYADRIASLADIESPTEVHLELCFQYLTLWNSLLQVSRLETAVAGDQEMPDSRTSSTDEFVEKYRMLYEMGALSAKDIIASIAEAVTKAYKQSGIE